MTSVPGVMPCARATTGATTGARAHVSRSRVHAGAARRAVRAHAKGKGKSNREGSGAKMMSQVEQFMPPIDPDNEQFVIYVRSKRGLKAWYPLNVVTGGSAANTLVKGLDNDMSREMAQKSLQQNIGKAIYKDFEAIEKVARTMPMLKQAKEIEYGFAVLDKKNPRSMFSPASGSVMMIPSEEDCETPADKFQEMGDNLKKMFGQQ
ncbi:unnamed product [Ostreococcus tauri]|uniref:Unnamed product n=2 Tax=Ostreococcus tauri TaxID=70448 RepID=Q01G48_OSTTA|nr:unnamed product [Ostreococcus tauri]CAL50296.1 unnamed product [Ostreococcus tauri]|eukprot:XP_003074445.1 unnamed product [Ostreococcus tauri]